MPMVPRTVRHRKTKKLLPTLRKHRRNKMIHDLIGEATEECWENIGKLFRKYSDGGIPYCQLMIDSYTQEVGCSFRSQKKVNIKGINYHICEAPTKGTKVNIKQQTFYDWLAQKIGNEWGTRYEEY